MATGSDFAAHVPDVGFTELRTERLVLRRFRAEDAASLAAYRSHPDVARYQSWDAPFTVTQAAHFLAGLADSHPDTPGEWFQIAVVESGSGAHVGDVATSTDEGDPRLADVGVTLAPSAQGRGYGTEALAGLLAYLFDQRAKHRVAADCDVRNHASVAVLERLGMRREAHHVESAWWKGEWTDSYVYALLDHEWRARARGA
jgi:aminoglycoside 6'-N-acetyltransferase